MTLGYMFGGGVGSEPRGVELHQTNAGVQHLYRQVAEWTELTVGQILEEDLPEAPETRQSIGTIRESAHAIAVHDVLAEHGLRPSALGGLSLGGMSAACLAGAISRRALFEMLAHARNTPDQPHGTPEQGLALAFEPVGDNSGRYRGAGRPGVYLAGQFGPTADGQTRILMLSGERAALDDLGTELPADTVVQLPGRAMAIHSPLRSHFRAFMAPYIDAMPFTDPGPPLLSCLDNKVLTTAADVRDTFHRNPTDPINLMYIYEAMKDEGVRLGLVVGGSIPDGVLRFPFSVLHVDRPEHIEQVLTMVFELGIEVFPTRAMR
ncbi:malonyl transferase [Nocardia sp. CNY236]|uniref:malonyl transferase n=1 Tax=Nocardia sp. CNY236 TaxID=1169152 RepID=UPI0004913B5C|nr:malonyl transferase [Nocardia sp. CNY236]